MKILITGATGLVGNELASLLLQNGISVNYLTTSKKKLEDEPNYKGFLWNPERGIIDENCIVGVDAIIHLAGATVFKRWTSGYKQQIIESRMLSANLIFKLLKTHAHQVKQIVSASAIGIYADSLNHFYSEDDKNTDGGFLGNVVLKWEQSVDKFRSLNIKVCKLRTGIVLSNKGGALTEMVKPIKMGMGAPFGSGNQFQSWIHIHDLVAMYLFAVKEELEGIYNAVAPNPVTNKEMTTAVAKTLKKPLFIPGIPQFIMKIILGEMHELLYSSQNVNSEKIVKKGFDFKYRTLSKAVDHLLARA